MPTTRAATSPAICDNWMWELPLRENVEALSRSLIGARILDVGCGQGLIADFFTSLGAHVTAIDIVTSPRWRRGVVGGPRYVCGNSEQLPFRDGAFDSVISCSTLQYMHHPSVFAELVRVTKDGGTVLLNENMPYNPAILLYRLTRRARALFSPSLKAYCSMITEYLTPDYSFPAAMRLERYRCYYFLSAVSLALCRPGGSGPRSKLARLLFRLDDWLLRRMPLLHKLCWFCSYTLRVGK